jgi:hypothetical protein
MRSDRAPSHWEVSRRSGSYRLSCGKTPRANANSCAVSVSFVPRKRVVANPPGQRRRETPGHRPSGGRRLGLVGSAWVAAKQGNRDKVGSSIAK